MFLSATIISAHKPEHDVRYLNCDSVTMNRCFFFSLHRLSLAASVFELYSTISRTERMEKQIWIVTLHGRAQKRVTIRSVYCYGSILQLSFAFQWMKRERERKTRTNDFYSFSLDCQQKRCLWRVLCETHWCRLNAVFLLSAHKHMWFDRKETDEWNKFNITMPQSIHSSIH